MSQPAAPPDTPGPEPEVPTPIREVDGLQVFVHPRDPTPDDLARLDQWWRTLLGRRLPAPDSGRREPAS